MENSKGTYVDGYVLVIPEKNIEEYKKMAEEGGKIWRKYGALEFKECIGDDMKSEWGIPFPKLVNLKEGEVVVFSFIVFKSKEHRDEVNAKVMADPAMSEENFKDKPMPFDMKRMAYGGFRVLVDA